MPDTQSPEALLVAMAEAEFGKHAPKVQQFIAAHWERRGEPETLREAFNIVVGNIFNNALLSYLRSSLWKPLEAARSQTGQTQQELAASMRLTQSTYAKIRRGATLFDNILLFLRSLGLDAQKLPLPTRADQTIEGLRVALPCVRYEAFGSQSQRKEARAQLSREDVEWLLHLDACGEAWVRAFIGRDATAGEIVATCIAAAMELRRGASVEIRPFADLEQLWCTWFGAWEACMQAIPTGRWV